MNNQSEQLDQLFTALAKAQEKMGVAVKDSTNPFLKSRYADLEAVVKASRSALAANGLCVIQIISEGPEGKNLKTRLGHSSGQWMESSVYINPEKKDIQSLGSYITYLRRYSYAAMVGVITSDDDDGESSMQRNGNQKAKEEKRCFAPEELNELVELSQKNQAQAEKILSHFGVDMFEEIGMQTEETIQRIKKSLKGEK